MLVIIQEFVTVATIHSDPDAFALKQVKQDSFNLTTLKVNVGKEKELKLLELLKSSQMKGFAVMNGGKLVFETYDQGMQKHYIQVLKSPSKTFTLWTTWRSRGIQKSCMDVERRQLAKHQWFIRPIYFC
ncbi:hypothetical protein [Aliiglaciecola sp. NS0011-25]|uniref:hypothetical protein n=1 Tax=Aliiglaciecola sp. NS0011-25 TaxID=3127654 RepID=UPI003104F479